ncbi:MAG: ribosomal protection-like ABC-F family protein [Clostridia bacterium]
MILLNCSNVTKSYGIDTIVEEVSFNICENDKIGLVGVNGAGKSTLFKLITGELSCDAGGIFKSKELMIGYMAQNYELDSQKTVWDEMMEVFLFLIDMEKNIKALEKQIESTTNPQQLEELVHEHAELCEEFKDKNGYGFVSRIRAVLVGLGFREEQFSLFVKHLSGGQKTRIALAKLLLQSPQLLLLDEPTNHLDIQAVEWLEGFLAGYSGSIMVISHDRFFLDKVSNKTIEIENKKATCYEGNYSVYMKQKMIMREQQWKQYNVQQREISRIQGIIEQQRQWNREKNIRTAESKQKSIDRMEKVDKPENLPDNIVFNFQTRTRSGNDILTAEELSKSYGNNHLFSNLGFNIKREEKIFLLGGNGTGKTTLFKILLDKEEKDSGWIHWGSNVVPGYYDQEHTDIDTTKQVIDEVWDANPELTQTEIRSALAAFLFKGDDVFKNISVLSGGEKGRIALVKLMLSKSNFLILDEPTNHLDIHSREALENALLHYNGTMFVISHDRYFINKIASKIFELTSNGITQYIGNYDDYIEKRKKVIELEIKNEAVMFSALSEDNSAKGQYQSQKEKKANERRIQKTIAELEEKISQCEINIQELEEQLCIPDVYSDYEKTLEITNRICELKKKIEQSYLEWEGLQEQLDI